MSILKTKNIQITDGPSHRDINRQLLDIQNGVPTFFVFQSKSGNKYPAKINSVYSDGKGFKFYGYASDTSRGEAYYGCPFVGSYNPLRREGQLAVSTVRTDQPSP